MNSNADYLGVINLLRHLMNMGCISSAEAQKIAARASVRLGSSIVISL